MATRKVILEGIKEYFEIYELVDKQTYEAHGERAWKFIDTDILEFLLIVRVNLGKKITINNWYWGGKFSQRGLRTNTCSIVKNKTNKNKLYLSAHTMGKGLDFDVDGMTAEEVRMWIVEKGDLFPVKIRLEHKYASSGKLITWVHADVFWEEKNKHIYLFNV